MPSRTERSEKTAREMFLEQAAAYFDDLKASAANAPHGQIFNHAEAFAFVKGRELIQQSLETMLQEQVDEFEKENETTLCPKCQKKKRHQGYRWKERISSLGSINLQRRYDACLPCKLPEHVADAPFGLEGRYSLGLRRLAVFSAADESYRKGSEALEEYLGIKLSHNTIRDICQEEAPKMEEWQQTSPEIQKDFIESPGNVEVTMDGTCVNTTEGAKEVKVGIISKRPLGQGVLPEQWGNRNRRELPSISASVAFAAVEECGEFQKRVNYWRRQLRLGSTCDISALGDGALWIWNIILVVFGKVRECLDIYHALEYLSNTGKVLYGEQTAAYMKWFEETTLELLSGGFELIEKRLDRLEQEKEKEWTDREKESLRLLRGYLGNNRERLCYALRLAEGRAIGSGQVEGACKNLIGKRLKQTWAEWKVDRLDRMAVICAIRYSDRWKKYWKQAK